MGDEELHVAQPTVRRGKRQWRLAQRILVVSHGTMLPHESDEVVLPISTQNNVVHQRVATLVGHVDILSLLNFLDYLIVVAGAGQQCQESQVDFVLIARQV